MKKLIVFANATLQLLQQHVTLVAVICAYSLLHLIWVLQDKSPALWDIAGHSYRSAWYWKLFTENILVGPLAVLQFETIYPPLQYIVTIPWYMIFGSNASIPQLSLLFWIWLFLISLYAVSLKVFDSKKAAVVSLVAVSMAPLFLHMSRVYFLDFPLTASVTAFVAALLYSDNGKQRSWTIAAGIAAAATLLIKWVAIIFLLGPLLFVLWNIVRESKLLSTKKRKEAATNILLSFFATVILLAPWYILHSSTVLASAEKTRNNIFSVPYENLFSLENAWYYMDRLLLSAGWPIILFSLFAIIILWKQKNEYRWLLFFWFIVPYIIMTFFLHSKESRYFLPVYPMLFIAMGVYGTMLRKKIMALCVAPILLVGLFVQGEMLSSTQLLPESLTRFGKTTMNYLYRTVKAKNPRYGFTYPSNFYPEVQRIPYDIMAHLIDRPTLETDIHITVIPNGIFLTAQQIQFSSVLAGLHTPSSPVDYSTSTAIRDGDWDKYLQQSNYLITKTGYQGPAIWGPNLSDIAAIEEGYYDTGTDSIFSQFELLHKYTVTELNGKEQIIRLYYNPQQ